ARSRLARERKWASVTQFRCAFQTIGGSVQMRRTERSRYKFGRANSRRSRGTNASTRTIEMSCSALVFLQRNPRPRRRPVNGQYQEKFGLRSSASQKV